MIETVKELQSKGCGRMTPNTLIHYWNIYLKYLYYEKRESSKMQIYTNVSEECFTSERTVMSAVKFWQNNLDIKK